jgi:predicted DNA-binding protein (MmcQ/YjbR family)
MTRTAETNRSWRTIGSADEPSGTSGPNRVSQPRAIRRRVLTHALGFPGAYEDHPWDEDVAKVGSKIFVFLGMEDSPEPGMTVKLRESHEQALSVPGAVPAGYGLGRSGWVSVPFGGKTPPLAVLKDWVEESYRVMAPKRLVAELDERVASRSGDRRHRPA